MQLDHTFGALADPTRRAILARLARGEATVVELAEPFDISLPAISRHLKVLEQASLISNERVGKHRGMARAAHDDSYEPNGKHRGKRKEARDAYERTPE